MQIISNNRMHLLCFNESKIISNSCNCKLLHDTIIANVVMFLFSNISDYINGATMFADNGSMSCAG